MCSKEKCKEEMTFRLDPKAIASMTEIRVFQKDRITLVSNDTGV